MRLIRKTLTAAGAILATLDPHKEFYTISGTMYGDTAVNATAQVDATISDLSARMPVTVSRSGTTVTVTFPSGVANTHNLGGTKDYIYISGTGNSSLDGLYPVASVSSATVLTYTSGTSGTVGAMSAIAIPIRTIQSFIASASVSATTPALPSVSATSINLNTVPFSGLVLNCTIYTAGTVILDVLAAGMR